MTVAAPGRFRILLPTRCRCRAGRRFKAACSDIALLAMANRQQRPVSIHLGNPNMPGLLVNIDVPDIDQGVIFYTAALGLRVGRRFGKGFIELLGTDAPIYLLQNKAGTIIGPAGGGIRRYERHWSPVHLDIVVDDLEAAIKRAVEAGAAQEGETREAPYGELATFADPFGHGFCLIEFNEQGYDAIKEPA